MSDEDKTPIEPAEEPEVEPETDFEPEVEPETDFEPEVEPEPEVEQEPEVEPEVEPDTDVEPEVDPGDTLAWDATAVLPEIAPDTATAQAASEDVPRDMDLGPEKRSRWWVWVLIVLVALALVGGGIYAWWYMNNRPVVVPDVLGKTPAEATQVLNDVGLRLGKETQEPTDIAPVGTIIEQAPAIGATLVVGSPVSLVVAAPSQQAKVPAVAGLNADEATTDLAKAQLAAKVVSSYSTTAAAGFVVSQLPAPGTEMPPGSSVALVVSKGQQPMLVAVPNLSRVTETESSQMLEATGLKPALYRSYNASVPAGEIVTQSPVPGSRVPPNTTVQYLVSQGVGTAPVTIPSLVASTEANAKTALKNRGLTPKVRPVPSAIVPKGQVISQMPPAGSTAARGGIVGLLVSTGNMTQANVPNAGGLSSLEASKTIKAAGFTPVVLKVTVSGEATGTVFAQFPVPGTKYSIPFPVVALVATAPK